MKSIFWFFQKNVKIFNGYIFRELQWFSSNKPQTTCYNGWMQQALWNKHIVLDIMDHFKCSHEIMTHRKNEWMEMMSSYNRLLSIYACLKSRMYQNNCDISLLKYLFFKNTANLKECVAAITFFITKRALSPYEWLQWNCESALKNEMTASACFKETQYPRSLQVTFWNNDGTIYMYGC